MKTLKKKRCKVCNTEYQPYSSLSKACSVPCAIEFSKLEEQKKFDKITRAKKKEIRENDKAWWTKKTQTVFNRYIRERDKGQACISCGRKTGCKMNAGHYRSVGAMPYLRFEPKNVHIQCEHCNSFKSGNIGDYRIGLINKLGLKDVEWLEGEHKPKHYSIDDLKALIEQYNGLYNEIKSHPAR